MKREDLAVIAQLLTSMKDALEKFADAQKKRSLEKANAAKKEILYLQSQINNLL